jgi:hypothetical protein
MNSSCGECGHCWSGSTILNGKLECPLCGAVWNVATGEVTFRRRAEGLAEPQNIAADPGRRPSVTYGCGHLSPIGWCGPCGLKMASQAKEKP